MRAYGYERNSHSRSIYVLIIVLLFSLSSLFFNYKYYDHRRTRTWSLLSSSIHQRLTLKDVQHILNNNLDHVIREKDESMFSVLNNNYNLDEKNDENDVLGMEILDTNDIASESIPFVYESSNDNSSEEDDVSNGRKLNVVILYPDDWRYDMMSNTNKLLKTPFMDSLADEGMRFTHNCVTTSICWISRATLFTGQWLSQHQSYKLRCPHFSWNTTRWSKTWPSLLQQDGYYVGHIGKWQYYDMNNLANRYNYVKEFEGSHWERFEGKKMLASDRAAYETIKFFKTRPKDQPFAVTVAFYPPKPIGTSAEPGDQWFPSNETLALFENITVPEPYNMTEAFSRLPPHLQSERTEGFKRWKQRYSTSTHYQAAMKRVYALVNGLDTSMKRIIDELKAEGVYNDTMIIITADNGMFHGAHGLAGKWYPYQESIRVPLIIKDPRMSIDVIGTLSDAMTLNVDLAETILGAAGIKPDPSMQGRDISDIYLPKLDKRGVPLLERNPWRKDFFYEFLIPEEENAIPPSTAVVGKEWKYIRWNDKNPNDRDKAVSEQLFHLVSDPLELNDLSKNETYSTILGQLRNRFVQLSNEVRSGRDVILACDRILPKGI